MKVAARRTVPPPDLLTALDVTNLLVGARGVPMHVAALALLAGGPLLDAAGELQLDAVREHVGARLPRRLHQRLVVPARGTPFGLHPNRSTSPRTSACGPCRHRETRLHSLTPAR